MLCQPDFDCQEIHGLCPGEVVQASCTLNVDQQTFFVQQWEVAKCREKKLEFDFTHINKIGDVECETCECPKCANNSFCAKLESKSPHFITILNFTMLTEYDGKTIKCFKLLPHDLFNKTCEIKLAEIPSSPSNITTTNCRRSLISWDPPHFTGGSKVSILNYQVNITSSDGKNWKHTVSDVYTRIPYQKINSNTTYIVCVSAVNCVGASQPTCKDVIMVPEEPPVTGLSATVINHTDVHLTWQKINTSTEICYDLENNFKIFKRCIQKPHIVLTVTSHSIYQIRVRARRDGKPGKWSDPICIIISVPPQLILTNYTLNREQTNMTIFLMLYENPVINKQCTIVPVTNISIEHDVFVSPTVEYHPFNGSGVNQRFDVSIGNNVSNRSAITFMFRAHNIVGAGYPIKAHVPIINSSNPDICGLAIIHTGSIISVFLPIVVVGLHLFVM